MNQAQIAITVLSISCILSICAIDQDNNEYAFLNEAKDEALIESGEYDLLIKHNTALEIAALRGTTNPIQWKLGKLNPKRWDSKESNIPISIPEHIQVNLVGKGVEELTKKAKI